MCSVVSVAIKEAEGENLIDSTAIIDNSTIIPPCFIGKNVYLKNSTIGPVSYTHLTLPTNREV